MHERRKQDVLVALAWPPWRKSLSATNCSRKGTACVPPERPWRTAVGELTADGAKHVIRSWRRPDRVGSLPCLTAPQRRASARSRQGDERDGFSGPEPPPIQSDDGSNVRRSLSPIRDFASKCFRCPPCRDISFQGSPRARGGNPPARCRIASPRRRGPLPRTCVRC